MWETQDRSLSWEGPLEKGMATHSSVLAWKIPWMEDPGGPQSMELHRVRPTEQLTHTAEESKMVTVRGFTKSQGQSMV